ncbi:MAG: hypothetical protein IJA62_03255 [Ruminococcus sp.]|nr:hypothetical protein [Ruminococcus sp.]
MSKVKVIAILAVLVLSLGIFAVQAETQPAQTPVTEPATVPVQTQPYATEPVESQPVVGTVSTAPTSPTDTSEPATGIAGTTAPTATTAPATEATEPTTFVRPTEMVTEPATYSNYVSPAPIYTPGNQDYNKKDWENIELDLSDENAPANPGGSFLNIKNNTSTEDERNPMFLILAIVFWFLALSAITFLLLYRPEKKLAAAKPAFEKKEKKAKPEKSPRYEKKYTDDYNDGY